MKKLCLIILCLCSLTAFSQNYTSPGIPSGTDSKTPTFRYKAATPDSIAQIWLAIGGNKFYRMLSGMDVIVFDAKVVQGLGTTSSKLTFRDTLLKQNWVLSPADTLHPALTVISDKAQAGLLIKPLESTDGRATVQFRSAKNNQWWEVGANPAGQNKSFGIRRMNGVALPNVDYLWYVEPFTDTSVFPHQVRFTGLHAYTAGDSGAYFHNGHLEIGPVPAGTTYTASGGVGLSGSDFRWASGSLIGSTVAISSPITTNFTIGSNSSGNTSVFQLFNNVIQLTSHKSGHGTALAQLTNSGTDAELKTGYQNSTGTLQKTITYGVSNAGILHTDNVDSIGDRYADTSYSHNGKRYDTWIPTWKAVKSRIDSAITAHGGGNTIYTGDGSLTGNRNVRLDGDSLNFIDHSDSLNYLDIQLYNDELTFRTQDLINKTFSAWYQTAVFQRYYAQQNTIPGHSSDAISEVFPTYFDAIYEDASNFNRIKLDTTGTHIANTVSGVAAYYDGHYQLPGGTYIPDKISVDSIAITKADSVMAAGSTVHTSNGLTGTGTIGDPVVIGGALSGNTDEDIGANSIDWHGDNGTYTLDLLMDNTPGGSLLGLQAGNSAASHYAGVNAGVNSSTSWYAEFVTNKSGNSASVHLEGNTGITTITDGVSSLGGMYAANYTTAQRLQRLAIPSVNTVIALADSVKGTISSGGVTSVSAGTGMNFTTITSTGAVNADTTALRTVANSRTLAQTQTALNLKANLASPTFTGTVTIPNGGVFGTPASLTLTNATGLPNAGLVNSTISGVALGSNLAALTATDATLTFSGSYTGATARTVGLNLANANTWTGIQTLNNSGSVSSGIYNSVPILLNINNSGSGGYRGIYESVFEQANGSGIKYLIDLGTNSATNGSGTHTSFFSVTNAGIIQFGNSSNSGTLTYSASGGGGFGSITFGSINAGSMFISSAYGIDIGGGATVSPVSTDARLNTRGQGSTTALNWNFRTSGGTSIFKGNDAGLWSLGNTAGTAYQVPIVNAGGTAMAWGATSITQASADLTAQTSAGNITTFTVGASTATFNISSYLNVTAISTDVIQIQVTYTDENNTAQTISLNTVNSVANANYNPVTIRAKNATTITVKTNLTVGAGSVTFDAGARIQQL